MLPAFWMLRGACPLPVPLPSPTANRRAMLLAALPTRAGQPSGEAWRRLAAFWRVLGREWWGGLGAFERPSPGMGPGSSAQEKKRMCGTFTRLTNPLLRSYTPKKSGKISARSPEETEGGQLCLPVERRGSARAVAHSCSRRCHFVGYVAGNSRLLLTQRLRTSPPRSSSPMTDPEGRKAGAPINQAPPSRASRSI